MNVLLDTNIIIHREASRILNLDIGILFRWLDKGRYTKCIHPVTIEEIMKNSNAKTASTFKTKLESYHQLRSVTSLHNDVKIVSEAFDLNVNDKNDTTLLNEVYCERIDFLITEDKKIHSKAKQLGINDRVFTIDSFLEKIVSENPGLVDYKVLAVEKKRFSEVNLSDPFFDSFKEDYIGFEKWFLRKSDEIAYVTTNKGRLLSFLYLKVEDTDEPYSDIVPNFYPKKRLKIGTFKVISNGVRLGERFLKIIFDNALRYKVEEIYVTIFDKRSEQTRLINLLSDWGFNKFGKKTTKNGNEVVFVRDFSKKFSIEDPKTTFPYISRNNNIFMIPIYPEYHTDLLPDSILTTESPFEFKENQPHRNAIKKVYISRSIRRDIKKGDVIIFYRTSAGGRSAYYSSVITTIAIAEEVIFDIKDEEEFVLKCRKRSVFDDNGLKEQWNWIPERRPFIINFLYSHSFPTGERINRQKLLDLKILTGERGEIRGLKQISRSQFDVILEETHTNESLIVD
jgi:predicted nucleic acid-binding protein